MEAWDGVQNFSESFLKFTPQLKLLDWFTATNHLALDETDNDLNSSGATLIPGTHLMIGRRQGGGAVYARYAHLGTFGGRARGAAFSGDSIALAQSGVLGER